MTSLKVPNRLKPPQKNLIGHWFDKYNHSPKDGIVPSSIGDTSRLPQPGRAYQFDGVDDKISFNDLSGITVSSFEGTTTPTINGNDIEFTAGLLYELILSDGTLLKCEDSGLIAFDSSGNGNHGTKVNTDALSANTFHYEGSDVPKSYQNDEGFSARGAYFSENRSGIRLATSFRSILKRDDDFTISLNFYGGNKYSIGTSYTLFAANPSDSARFALSYSFNNNDIIIALSRRNSTNDGNDVDLELIIDSSEIHLFESSLNNITITNSSSTLGATYNGTPFIEAALAGSTGGGNSTVYIGANQANLGSPIGSIIQDTTINGQLLNQANQWGGAITINSDYYLPKVLGNEADESGLPLQYKGAVSYPAKLVESNCVSLDGVDDHITFPPNTNNTLFNTGSNEPFVWKAWLRLTESGRQAIYVSGSQNITAEQAVGVETSSSRQLIFTVRDNSAGSVVLELTTVNSLDLDVWYLLELSWDAQPTVTGMQIIINGEQVPTTDTSAGNFTLIKQTTSPPNIGIRGVLDGGFDIAYFSFAKAGEAPFHELAFSEGAGDTVFDVSGNNNHGNLNDGATWAKQDVFHYNYENGFWEYSPKTRFNGYDLIRVNNTSLNSALSPNNNWRVNIFVSTSENMNSQLIMAGLGSGTRRWVTGIKVINGNLKFVIYNINSGDYYKSSQNIVLGQTYELELVSVAATSITGSVDGIDMILSNSGEVSFGTSTSLNVLIGGNKSSNDNDNIDDGLYGDIDNIQVRDSGDTLIANIIKSGDTYIESLGSYPVTDDIRTKTFTYPIQNPLQGFEEKEIYPSLRNHNGAETKVDFNPYNAPALREFDSPLDADALTATTLPTIERLYYGNKAILNSERYFNYLKLDSLGTLEIELRTKANSDPSADWIQFQTISGSMTVEIETDEGQIFSRIFLDDNLTGFGSILSFDPSRDGQEKSMILRVPDRNNLKIMESSVLYSYIDPKIALLNNLERLKFNHEGLNHSFITGQKGLIDMNIERLGYPKDSEFPDHLFYYEDGSVRPIESLTIPDSTDNSIIQKVNILKNSLKYLHINNISATEYLPEPMLELPNLETLFIGVGYNTSTYQMPNFVNSLTSLKLIQATRYNRIRNFDNIPDLVNIERIEINRFNDNQYECTFPSYMDNWTSWTLLHLYDAVSTDAKLNLLIDNLYDYITRNITADSDGSDPRHDFVVDTILKGTVNGNYQQPSGYIQDSNNGTPANENEKLWVLNNQYNVQIT